MPVKKGKRVHDTESPIDQTARPVRARHGKGKAKDGAQALQVHQQQQLYLSPGAHVLHKPDCSDHRSGR